MSVVQVEARPEEIVYFVVLCQPKSGPMPLEVFREKLSLETIRELTPSKETLQQVITTLRENGFTVYTQDPSPVVTASGTLKQFQEVFRTEISKYVRHNERTGLKQEFFELSGHAPNTDFLPGALSVEVQKPPEPCAFSALPPSNSGFYLRQPGDIAIATKAALVHRQKISTGAATGQRATGEGVVVAMIDTGVHHHPFFDRHGYDLRHDRASDVTDPADHDNTGHGTRHTASIFACAPDATVIGIKMGNTWTLPFDRARAVSAKVINYSQAFVLGNRPLEEGHLTLRILLLTLVSEGITLVVSGGNFADIVFPAMMPEVIAVGGVTIDSKERISASSKTSSFRAVRFGGRAVPDLCGVASMMALPVSPPSTTPASTGWKVLDGLTSDAAPQVAGVAALMLQKNPALTPDEIKTKLKDTARDVDKGTSGSGDPTIPGLPDLATGAGLVDALEAWLIA